MPPSIAPVPFYGNNRASWDMIQQIRVSRLIHTKSTEVSTTEKKRNSKLSLIKHRYTGEKLFAGVSHGIKKPKSKKLKLVMAKMVSEKLAVKPTLSVREKMRNKFDFSRTPYAIPVKRRIALNEEMSKKRKFFKSTIETTDQNRATLSENESILDFEDMDDVNEQPFAEIKEDVANTLYHIDWSDDEECMKPLITRQKADVLANSTSSPNTTYLTLTNAISEVDSLTPTSKITSTPTSVISDINSTTPTSQAYSCVTHLSTKIKHVGSKENVIEVTPTQVKYFPVFSSPATKNILSDATNKLKKSKNSLDKAAAPGDQYQIDAGQKVIGPRECLNCKMVYDIGDPYDKLRHDQYHNLKNNLKYKSTKTENVVGYCGTDRIILIKQTEEKKRKKVIEILKVTEEEIGTGYSFESSAVAYIYVRHESILGCLIAEPNVEASRIIKSDGIVLLSNEWQRVKCGINRIWVKQTARGQNIATELMNCLRKNFRYGEYLETDEIAFSAPTPDGHAFARKYTKRDDYLTYLGSIMK